ncbi:acyltransferase [Paraburkholderia largidicola]|uniref:Acyltransferase n=2 Tax=Paraburkholderia largidicola TaxID=3014751 RepID=A0A7I8BKZ8_9BURK|nr:acyltransferase [Paraburkholderia sp. PGU16]
MEINRHPPFWGGVDLFFCVSGFVICKSLVRSGTAKTFSEHWDQTWKFWVRRFFRIVPTLWLWVALGLLGSWLFNDAGGFGDLRANLGDARAALLNYANIHMLGCIFGHGSCGPNAVYWSLSLEEQFYLLLPLVLLLPSRVVGCIVVALILFQMPFQRIPWDRTFGGILWFFRTDAMLLGASLAYLSTTRLYTRAGDLLENLRRFRLPVSAILIAALMAVPASGISVATAGIAVVSCALVFLASYNRQFLFGTSKLTRPFLWIGTRSFSIYLLHMPVAWFVNELGFRFSSNPESYRTPLPNEPFHLWLTIATFATVFTVAELNYRIVETPLRRYGRRITDERPNKSSREPAMAR